MEVKVYKKGVRQEEQLKVEEPSPIISWTWKALGKVDIPWG